MNSKPPHIVFHIKPFINYFNQSSRLIQLMWIPSFIVIHGNLVAVRLAKNTSNTVLRLLARLPWTDFAPILRCRTFNLWSNHCNILPANFATKYKNTVRDILNKSTWSNNINPARCMIVHFNRHHMDHSHLIDHAYKLGSNDSSLHSTSHWKCLQPSTLTFWLPVLRLQLSNFTQVP